MRKKILVLLSIALVLSANLRAQVTIGGLNEPKAGALLDLNSTIQGGLVLSNVDLTNLGVIPANTFVNISAEQDSNPELAGMIVYNTYEPNGIGVHVWDGYDWIKLCAPPAPGPITLSETSFCAGSPFTAKIDSVKGATSYVWSLPNGLTGSSNDTIITISGAVGTYPADSITVRAVSSCGGGTRRKSPHAIVINALPAVPTDASSNSGASGTSIVFSASVPTGHEIDWYDAAIGGTKKQTGVNSFSETLTTTKTYYAESRNSTTGCVSASRLAVSGNIIISGCDPLPSTPLITSDNVEFVNNNTPTYTRNTITLSTPVKIVGKGSKTSLSSESSSLVDYRDHSIDTDIYGSWFTWCMVAYYADILCPSPWKVPTLEDFCWYANGSTTDAHDNSNITSSDDGWQRGGYASGSSTGSVNAHGNYWSSTPNGMNYGYSARVNTSRFYPRDLERSRHFGYSLRCVKTTP
jgi:uncharacterized protein (TIGR02145 family)